MIQSLISGLVPFQINNSTVTINNSAEQNKKDSVLIKYIISNNNSNIIVNNCNLNKPEFIAYAYNNSNIYIDEKTLDSAKRKSNRFVADNNSFINYNFPAVNTNASLNYLQPIYNNGESYISYDNITDTIETNKNRLVYNFADVAAAGIIKITPEDNLNTLSAVIIDLQKKINKIPSVLNGYTLVIDLSKLTANFSDVNIANPLIVNKFYQGTVKIVGDPNKIIKYTIDTTTSLTPEDFEKYLNTSQEYEKNTRLALPFLLISEVDDCIIDNLSIQFSNTSITNDKLYSIVLLNDINNLIINNINLNMNLNSSNYNTFDLLTDISSLYKFNQLDGNSIQYNFACRNLC